MDNFTVTPPAILKKIFGILMIIGLIFSIVTSCLAYYKISNTSIGHVIFGLVLFTIGLVVVLYAIRWKIKINGNKISIQYFLKPAKIFSVDTIDKIVMGKKMQIMIVADNKTLVTVDFLANNYEELLGYLKSHNIEFINQ